MTPLGELTRSAPWMVHAACRGMDQTWWFPTRGRRSYRTDSDYAQARRICQSCPVADECLEHALKHPEQYGLYGGKTPDERRKILKVRRDRGLRINGASGASRRGAVPSPGWSKR